MLILVITYNKLHYKLITCKTRDTIMYFQDILLLLKYMWYTSDLEFDFDLEHHRNQIGNNINT